MSLALAVPEISLGRSDLPHLTRPNFAEIFGVRKLESLGYRAALFARSLVQPFL